MLSVLVFVATAAITYLCGRAVLRLGRAQGYRRGCEDVARLWVTADEMRDATTGMVEPGGEQGHVWMPEDRYRAQLRAAQEGRQ
jgi:hypothetical protein